MVPGSAGFPLLFRLFEWWGSGGACPYFQEKRQAVEHLFAWGPAERGCKPGTRADIKQSILEYRPQGPSLTAHPQGSLSHILLIASFDKGLSTMLCPVFQWWPGPFLIRWILPLWKALAANNHVARDVIILLYIKLKLRPPRRLLQSTYRARLVSLMVSSTLCYRPPAWSPRAAAVSRASIGSWGGGG